MDFFETGRGPCVKITSFIASHKETVTKSISWLKCFQIVSLGKLLQWSHYNKFFLNFEDHKKHFLKNNIILKTINLSHNNYFG